MLPRTETSETIANHWLARFERALAESDDILLETLFHPDSHWRDVLALTWHIRTVSGLDAILRALKAHVARANPSDFRTDLLEVSGASDKGLRSRPAAPASRAVRSIGLVSRRFAYSLEKGCSRLRLAAGC